MPLVKRRVAFFRLSKGSLTFNPYYIKRPVTAHRCKRKVVLRRWRGILRGMRQRRPDGRRCGSNVSMSSRENACMGAVLRICARSVGMWRRFKASPVRIPAAPVRSSLSNRIRSYVCALSCCGSTACCAPFQLSGLCGLILPFLTGGSGISIATRACPRLSCSLLSVAPAQHAPFPE
jgi:hypothetical protein